MSSRYCSFSFIDSGFDPAFTQSKISQQQQQQQQQQQHQQQRSQQQQHGTLAVVVSRWHEAGDAVT